MKNLLVYTWLENVNSIKYKCGINNTLGNVLFTIIINFTYICKGYIYEYKEASASSGRCLFYMYTHMTKLQID